MNKSTGTPSFGSFVALGLALGGLVGCSHGPRLTESHGRAYHQAFKTQPAHPEAARKARKLPGLDAQEAQIVAENYSRSLRVKETQRQDQGLILMAPPSNAQPYMPPPSVPEGRR